jgi:ABC-type uncharacterized transport system ATPase subunit
MSREMIHGFKAFEPRAQLNLDIELEKNGRVYCFIGENGAGKRGREVEKTLVRGICAGRVGNSAYKGHRLFV